jgi:flagellar protein FlgJ
MKIGDPSAAQQLGLDHISTQIPAKSSIEDSPEAIREAARTFESLFLNEIMKNMRKTLPQDGLLNQGFANNVFNSMLDQEYSQIASKSGQLGLADVIARQLGADPAEIAQREAREAEAAEAASNATVSIDGEEVPAWALEEIPADPWTPDSSPERVNPSDKSIVTPGLSAPKNSEFTASARAVEAYQLLSQPSTKKR